MNAVRDIGSPPPNPELVDMVKDLLRRAESGELRNFCGVGVLADGAVWRVICDPKPCRTYELLGALRLAEQRILDRFDP